jgi:hypothetical protein
VMLNSNTGLIGMPTQEIGGVMCRSLINPNIVWAGGLVQINQGDVQGLLRGVQPTGESNTSIKTLVGQIATDGLFRVLKRGEHLELPQRDAARPPGDVGRFAGRLPPEPALQIVEGTTIAPPRPRPTRSGSRCRMPARDVFRNHNAGAKA